MTPLATLIGLQLAALTYDAAGRDAKAQVVYQGTVSKCLCHTLHFDHNIPKPRPHRDGDGVDVALPRVL